MNDLTSRFLAYRQKLKASPDAPSVAVERVYPTDGYISASETAKERQNRIFEAELSGFTLQPLDRAFLDQRVRLTAIRSNRHWKKCEVKWDAAMRGAEFNLRRQVPGCAGDGHKRGNGHC